MKIIISLITTLLMATSFAAETKIKMYFPKEDILKIIEMYSKATGQKFVIDPSVRGQVSILVQEPVSSEEAFNQLSSALALNGFAISKQDDTMIIQNARSAQRNLIEVNTTLPPLQNERGPLAEIVGMAGVGLTVTVIEFEFAVHPFESTMDNE